MRTFNKTSKVNLTLLLIIKPRTKLWSFLNPKLQTSKIKKNHIGLVKKHNNSTLVQ